MNWGLVKEIFIPVATAFATAALTKRYLEKGAVLLSYLGHVADFNLQNNLKIYTHSVVVRNSGKRPAKEVRICHSNVPVNYQILPGSVKHRVETMPDGGQDIVLDKLIPGEQAAIQYLYFSPYQLDQIHRGIKSDEGYAQELRVLPSRQLPRWVKIGIVSLAALGAGGVLYFLIQVAQWIAELVSLTQ